MTVEQKAPDASPSTPSAQGPPKPLDTGAKIFLFAGIASSLLTLLYRLSFTPDRFSGLFSWGLLFIVILLGAIYVAPGPFRRLWRRIADAGKRALFWAFPHAGLRDEVRALATRVDATSSSLSGAVSARMEAMERSLATLTRTVGDLSRISEPVLFARVAGLDGGSMTGMFHILFTHKDDGHKDEYAPGEGEQYRIPGFPYDEAEPIMWLWAQLARNHVPLGQMRAQCSRVVELAAQNLKTAILNGPHAIVGSPKGNFVADAFMKEYKTAVADGRIVVRGPKYVMKVGHEEPTDAAERAYLYGGEFENPPAYWPTPTTGDPELLEQRETPLRDYAVFMKVPNLLAVPPNSNNVLMLAGCKVGGQCGLTDWLSNAENLAYLARIYAGGYFSVVLAVDYRYRHKKLPKVERVEKLFDVPIDYIPALKVTS